MFIFRIHMYFAFSLFQRQQLQPRQLLPHRQLPRQLHVTPKQLRRQLLLRQLHVTAKQLLPRQLRVMVNQTLR